MNNQKWAVRLNLCRISGGDYMDYMDRNLSSFFSSSRQANENWYNFRLLKEVKVIWVTNGQFSQHWYLNWSLHEHFLPQKETWR